ncbi:hypothetical protein TTHERM_01043330 (macronuclear) [Tetrahymena thermophila SB210]|uniref:Uncharacterized protein n=1 Tax=Tetrahymena thermophila (strain SB210) TaxID=312017 RepID=Q22CH6_TETTS|nr:hypothetical protein TTHERM_01043330 [Tetrahymena thermophila SB210]EAR83016.2 hypothetical protein TTHERM_01043330 [Tetrahymena thermophila SB210]|eukprot:XP_001030679.2 hypothetical protein TTHERM_01043330 [Tetrahymena thermophila SB210]
MEVKMEKENQLQETSLQSSIKQSSQRPLTVFPSLNSKVPNLIEKAQSSRSSGGSKSEDICENCQKTKVCIQQKCIESQEVNFCCEKCYKKKHADHFKDFVIDISSIDSQIRKLHQEVIDGPLFRLATDLKEMFKDFNDFKKLFPQIQEIPIVEFALHSKRINQANVKQQKEDYDKMRKESIKNAIKISKIEKKSSKLKLHIDEIEIENNTFALLKRYEDIIQQQQLKLDEFKERTNKIFQDIRKAIPPTNNVYYTSLAIGSKPVRFLEKDTTSFQKEKNSFQSNNNYNSTQERDDELLSYNNNSTLNSYNSNNNNSFNNQQFNFNNQLNQHGQLINSSSSLMMVSQVEQNNIFNNTQVIKKGVENLENNNQPFIYQNQCYSNSISNQRFDSNSNSKRFTSDILNFQPLLEKQLQDQYEQYTQQKLEAISQTGPNSNHKPLSRSVNNLFSESNQNNNSISYSNSNIDQLRSTPYKQQKTQKKINEYFVSNKNPKGQVKQEEQNQIKQTLLQDEKFIQQQQQQLLFYQQQKDKQIQDQQKLQAQKQLLQTIQPNKQNNTIQQEFQNLQKKQQLQLQQQQHQLLFKNQSIQQQQQQQQQQPDVQQIPVLKQESVGQKLETNILLPNKKVDNVFMKNDAFLIDELMKLTQSTVYTQNEDENDLRKSPSFQAFTNSQLNSFPNNKSLTDSYIKDKLITNQIIIEESQESNTNKFKQPTVLNSLDLLCQEQLSDVNEQSNSIQIEVNVSDQKQTKQSEININQTSQKQKPNIISIPSTSSLSSVSKQEVNEAKVFYQQTFGAQPDQPKEDQQIAPSQDFYCWETMTDTQNKDKNK